MKILDFFLFLWVIFARIQIADPDPDPATQINADPDPKPWPFITSVSRFQAGYPLLKIQTHWH
jgi:hypothetical protein